MKRNQRFIHSCIYISFKMFHFFIFYSIALVIKIHSHEPRCIDEVTFFYHTRIREELQRIHFYADSMVFKKNVCRWSIIEGSIFFDSGKMLNCYLCGARLYGLRNLFGKIKAAWVFLWGNHIFIREWTPQIIQ